jgi:sugar phosphate isomerase/epimerase
MAITRRQILAGMAALGAASAQQPPDGPRVPRPRTPPKPRTTPVVCLYSQHLIKVEYEAVGMVLRDLGFDGCDMAVVPGSHISPQQAGSDLMRGIEAVSGVGLEVPLISTSVNSGSDPNGQQILGIAGFMGVPLFRPGYWRYGNAPNREVRLAAVQHEILGLASVARAYNIATALHNSSGDCVGAGLTDLNGILRNVDPRWVGYNFDPGFATETAGVEALGGLMELAMPKLKAVTVRDFTWNKAKPDARKATPCPLGEGIVDWRPFFTALARARFVGPITIEVRYEPKDELNAFRHDLEFVRKQVAATYAAV